MMVWSLAEIQPPSYKNARRDPREQLPGDAGRELRRRRRQVKASRSWRMALRSLPPP